MPLRFAAGLYGILLGLGFTTFVLTFGVWALAAIAFAVGDPAIGALLGLAFGIGRAFPMSLSRRSPTARSGSVRSAMMAERPELLRGFRLGDAIALVASAAVLIGRCRRAPRRSSSAPRPTRRWGARRSSSSAPIAAA